MMLIAILAGISGGAVAQEKHYRVEIIVLSHLQHESEPLKAPQTKDYSQALDFLVVPEEEEESEVELQDDLTDLDLLDPLDPNGVELPEPEPEPWADILHIETRSDIMQEAWRRLRLSAPFRPQQYL